MERIKQRVLHPSSNLPGRAGGVPRPVSPVPAPSSPLSRDPDQEGGEDPCSVLTDTLSEVLSQMVARLLKVPVAQIDPETELSEYGFHSITFVQLADRLNQAYQLDLTPALFYEHSTISRLAQYLQATSADLLAPHLAEVSLGASELVPETVRESRAMSVPPAAGERRSRSLIAVSEQRVPTGAEPIAIIGISGSFPQAADVESLWSNLLEGRDCISEMPASRWGGPIAGWNSLIRSSLVFREPKPRRWTRSNGC